MKIQYSHIEFVINLLNQVNAEYLEALIERMSPSELMAVKVVYTHDI
jgi:hypothetical protein